jgi:hypothetical protein
MNLQFNSVLGWQKQVVQAGSVLTCYGRSRTSQMLAGLLLQFSVFQFCFFTFQDREGKRKTNKQTKNQEK